MNDFSRSSDILFSILYADVTSVFIKGTHFDYICEVLNNALEKVNIWLHADKLTISVKKTPYMIFHRTRIKQGHNITMYINKNPIERKSSTKFLGIIIDNKLNWSAHITYIKNKIISKIIKFLDKQTLRNMYFSFIYPYLIYCSETWENAHDTHLNPLIKIQKRGIRTITLSHYLEHSAPLFNKLNILDFKRLVKQRISLLMFKHHIILRSSINDLFTVNNAHHNYYTRQNNDLHITEVEERMCTDYLAFMVHIFGTIFLKKIISVYHTLAIKYYLRTTYKTIT